MIDAVYISEINDFKDSIISGCQVNTPYGKCKLLEKYPHMARTEKGCFNWNEIYLAEKGVRCDDRAKEVKTIVKGAQNV